MSVSHNFLFLKENVDSDHLFFNVLKYKQNDFSEIFTIRNENNNVVYSFVFDNFNFPLNKEQTLFYLDSVVFNILAKKFYDLLYYYNYDFLKRKNNILDKKTVLKNIENIKNISKIDRNFLFVDLFYQLNETLFNNNLPKTFFAKKWEEFLSKKKHNEPGSFNDFLNDCDRALANLLAFYVLKNNLKSNFIEKINHYIESCTSNDSVNSDSVNSDSVNQNKLNPYNIYIFVSRFSNWFLVKDMFCVDKTALFKNGEIKLENEEVSKLFYDEVVEKIQTSRSYLVSNLENKLSYIKEFANGQEFYGIKKKFVTKYLEKITPSFNFILSSYSVPSSASFEKTIKLSKKGDVYTIFYYDYCLKCKFSLKENSNGDCSILYSNYLFSYYSSNVNPFFNRCYSSFNTNKINLILNEHLLAKKTDVPETVELKIIDLDNEHNDNKNCYADFSNLKNLVDFFSNLGVSEIYLSDKNSIYHPNFIELVDYIHSKNMFLSMTVADFNVFKKEEFVQRFVTNKIMTVGLWVDNLDKIVAALKIKKLILNKIKKVFSERYKYNEDVVQYKLLLLVNIGNKIACKFFKELIEDISLKKLYDKKVHNVKKLFTRDVDYYFNVVLTDYSNKYYTETEKMNTKSCIEKTLFYMNLLYLKDKVKYANYAFDDHVVNLNFHSVGSNIKIVKDYKYFFFSRKIPNFALFYNKIRGKQSLYVDAVENKMAASLFCDKKELIPFSLNVAQFVEQWRKV